MGNPEYPFLERDKPLAQFAQCARAAGEGLGHLVLVTGEAGAGKTTLLRVFEAQTDAAVLHGACEGLSIAEPLGPLRDLTRAAGLDLDSLFRAEGERLAVFGSVLDALDAPGRATVLMIEDLHWADEATLDFVRFAARRLHDRRLLLVLTARDSESEGRPQIRRALRGVPPDDVTRIALQPFSAQAVATLAEGSGYNAADLHRITGGNPFYVTELLRGGAEGGLTNVQDTVLARCDSLDPQARALLDAVAVFPRRAERSWAIAAAGISETAIDPCVAAGLLEDLGAHLGFRHEIARQAVESALGPAQRRQLNGAVLAHMQAQSGVPHARLLHHARAAEEAQTVARLAPLAGCEALAAGANSQAADYLALAVQLADPEDRETLVALLVDAGEACSLVARLRDALDHFERALALRQGEDDGRGAAWITERLARLHWRMGRKARARELGDQAIEMLRGSETPELATALASRAQIAASDSDLDASLDLARRAVDLSRRLACWESLAHALSTLSLMSANDRAAMEAHRNESLAIASRHRQSCNLTRTHSNAGAAHLYRLEYDAALHHYDKGIALGHELDLARGVVFTRGLRLYLLDRMGRWDEVEAEASEVLANPSELSSPAIMARLAALRMAMRRGRPADDDMLDEVVALLGDEEDLRHVSEVACLFAERAWLGRDSQATAQAWLDRAKAMPGRTLFKEELFDWQRRLDPAQPLGSTEGMKAVYRASIAGDWHAAAEEWARVGDPYRQALALAEGDAAAVGAALQILDHLGAVAVLERVRSVSLDSGLDVGAPPKPRAATRASPAGLTRRQMDVLHLLNEGLSNAEIGARLFISPKTVDHHVSAILDRLEVATRGEAAARARDAGWLDQARPRAAQPE